MLLQLAKIPVYAALLAPLLVNRFLFFPFITGKALFFRIAVEIGLLALILLCFLPEFRVPALKKLKNPLVAAVTVFVLIFLITSLTAVNPQLAFWSNFERGEGAWQILHYYFFFLLAFLLFNSEEDWTKLLGWQATTASLAAVYALLQSLNPPPPWVIVPPSQPSGTLGNPSYLSLYLIFNLFFIGWLLLKEKERGWRWFWAGLGIFQFLILLLARNRASILALSLGVIIFLLGLSWQFFKSQRRRLAGLTLLIVLVVALTAGAFVGFIKGGDVFRAMEARLWTWQSALQGFQEKPLWGWGIENFPILFDKYYNPRHFGRESFFDRAHNIFLEYAASGGILLLLAYLSIFYFLFKQTLLSPKKYLAIIPLIYLVNGLVLFEVLPIYLMLFLFLAFAGNNLAHFPQSPPLLIRPVKLVGLAGLIGLVILGFSFYHTIYRPLQKNRLIYSLALAQGPIEKVTEDFDQALRYPSIVGQPELLQQLLNYNYNYLNLTEFTDRWFRQEQQQLVGVKELYLQTLTLVKVFASTREQPYAEQARELISEGRRLAPKRLEFIIEGIKLARLTKDSQTETELLTLAKKLRPDLDIDEQIKE